MAAVGLALLRLPEDVVIEMAAQSYPGTGGGGAAPVVPGDLPPLKWSSLRYVLTMEDEIDGEEAAYGRRGCREASAG